MAPDAAPTPLEGPVRLGFVVPHVRAGPQLVACVRRRPVDDALPVALEPQTRSPHGSDSTSQPEPKTPQQPGSLSHWRPVR